MPNQKKHILFKHKKLQVVLVHTSIWILYFFMPHILYNLPIEKKILIMRSIELFVLLCVFYFNALFLVPRFLIPKKYIRYFGIVVVLVISISQAGSFAKSHYFPRQNHKKHRTYESRTQKPCKNNSRSKTYKKAPAKIKHHFLRSHPGFISIFILATLALSAAYGYAQVHNKREKELKELEKERLSSELLFLKTQINPHFLFNILNSIYSLSLQKSDVLPGVVLKLSELLRYMTYDSEEKYVAIEKELEYIHNYIELQKLRLSQYENISYSVEKVEKSVQIAPLILIAFIENAFKHGILGANKTNINIHISITDTHIALDVTNAYLTSHQKDAAHGIGIQNVKRRLEIMYPNKHSLKISSTDTNYSVSLKIEHT